MTEEENQPSKKKKKKPNQVPLWAKEEYAMAVFEADLTL